MGDMRRCAPWVTFNNKDISVEKTRYEGWNFNSGNYLFTTDTK